MHQVSGHKRDTNVENLDHERAPKEVVDFQEVHILIIDHFQKRVILNVCLAILTHVLQHFAHYNVESDRHNLHGKNYQFKKPDSI
jgi:hypothetical protein